MTTGEYLVTHSSLASGTALAHLLALQTGTGSGETIFTSRMAVVVSLDEVSIDQRPPTSQVFADNAKVAYPLLDESVITITQKATATYVERRADEVVVSRKPSHPKVIER